MSKLPFLFFFLFFPLLFLFLSHFLFFLSLSVQILLRSSPRASSPPLLFSAGRTGPPRRRPPRAPPPRARAPRRRPPWAPQPPRARAAADRLRDPRRREILPPPAASGLPATASSLRRRPPQGPLPPRPSPSAAGCLGGPRRRELPSPPAAFSSLGCVKRASSWWCGAPSCARRGNPGRRGRSRLEPRKHGSASHVEAATSSSVGFTTGAAAKRPVWQGSGRSCSWSRSWSPGKLGLHVQDLNTQFNRVLLMRHMLRLFF